MEDGVILAPYNGQVKSILLLDDREPLSRKDGVKKLANFLIEKANITLANYNPKISLNSKGFRTSLLEEYTKLTKSLPAKRKKTLAGERKRTADMKALT